MNTKKTVILGIDPGYDRVGWSIGVKEKNTYSCTALGCIQTNKAESIFKRYQAIQADLTEIIAYFSPTQVAIETLFFSKNKKTALRVSEARGVIIGVCLDKNMEVFEYSPVEIKLSVTGNGAANKEEVEKMVRMQIKGQVNAFIDDAIDAVAIGLTHAFHTKLNFNTSRT